jgi:putative transposase
MSHSYSSALIHAVFSTKERKPTINDPEKLWAYIIGIEKELGIRPIATGGVSDHVHLLFALPGTIAFSVAIQKIKAISAIRSNIIGSEDSRKNSFP